METQWWVVLAVLAIIVAIVGYWRSLRTRDRNAQDLRMSVQAQEQAQLPGDRISQREDRRLAGMTAEDREWEQASLQRNRESQERI
jgi:type VI protein secretion system component VasK